jgi:hypothetical protein
MFEAKTSGTIMFFRTSINDSTHSLASSGLRFRSTLHALVRIRSLPKSSRASLSDSRASSIRSIRSVGVLAGVAWL